MRRLRASMSRLSGLFRSDQRDRAFAEEVESHLQMHVEDNVRAGMTPEAARRDAILKLGGLESTRQDYRERGTVPFVEHLGQDVRFAVRQLVKNPGFTVTAILMLGLGMGASVAIFAFVDAALIEPLPYPDPTRIVHVTESTPQIPRANLSYPDYLDWKRQNTVFTSLAVYTGRAYMLATQEGTEVVPGARVSDNFFRTLGVAPVLGRDFMAGEDLPGAPDTVILSDAAWRSRFGGRPDAIGRSIALSGVPHTVVGVLPRNFEFAPRGRVELWTTIHPSGSCDPRRSCHGLEGIARLKEGVSVQAALSDAKVIARQLEKQYPDSNRGQGASVLPLSEVVVGGLRPVLLALLAGAGLLLLIAGANVASLLLVRSESRKRELALRSALGASRLRLLGQFVTESCVLVTAGSLVGLAAASWSMQLLTRLIPADMQAFMPFLHRLGLHGRVLMAAGVIALLAAVLFSITPTLRASFSQGLAGTAEGGRGSTGHTWRRLGARFVVLELATAVVLLVGAGLLGQSLYRLLNVSLGFQPNRVTTLDVAAPRVGYEKDEQAVALARQIVGGIASLPGVQSVGLTSVRPVNLNGNTTWIRIPGRAYHGEHNEVNQRDVSADYFRTLQVRLLRGRLFTDAEDASKPRVVIVNQALARQYFPGEDPIGKQIGDTDLSPRSLAEVVGVVDDIREGALDSTIWPAVYYPFNQSPDHSFSLVVRASQAEQPVLQAVRAVINRIDPGIGTRGGTTMSDRIKDSPSAYLHRSSAWLVGGFAGLALLLAVIGLYGVVAYSVSQRTRELGVRIALGASRRSVYELILGEAAALAAVGIAVGLVCAVAAASLVRPLLFATTTWDLPTLGGVAVLLAASSLVASYVPAHRAASIDPTEALRAE